jgi:hypothetical protein
MSAIIEESTFQTQEKSNALLDHISSSSDGRKWLHSIKVQLKAVSANGADDDTSKVKMLEGYNQSLGVSGTYSSAVFYVYIQIPCHGNVNARFKGEIGGLFTPIIITPVL